jgi:raffinose/stachyose/melibiose transport system substrate-binding protein
MRAVRWHSLQVRSGESGAGRRRVIAVVATVLAVALFALGPASETRAASGDHVTITMLAISDQQPAWQVLIPNFERVYPNITVEATYQSTGTTISLENIELASGNATDLLETSPGCGTSISVCALAKAGYLAPMVKKPWTKRSLPIVTSLSKYGPGLYTFEPGVSFMGAITNDTLFAKIGLKVPQTFSQLLDVCRKAKADGTVAVLLAGADGGASIQQLIDDLAAAAVYGKQRNWTGQLKAGTVSFDGTAGWHQALQEFVDMSNASCFETGLTGTASVTAQFAAGQGLMLAGLQSNKGLIDPLSPAFSYSFHPFPGGSTPGQTETFLNLSTSLGVNAHSSAQSQAAAQTFIDFVARPAQDALYAELRGSQTQYQFLKGQLPSFMPALLPVLKSGAYVVNPTATWWNSNVGAALRQYEIGLLTGQASIDQILNAMDAAWKQGPA